MPTSDDFGRLGHLLQVSTRICAGLGVLAVLAALAPAAQAGSATTMTRSERSLVSAVNEVRRANGLRPLNVDGALLRVARSHSTAMIRTDVFTHGAMGARLAASGARGPNFGENLAWGVGAYASARYIVAQWLASPGHRANLLRPGWTRVGIGAVRGTFAGRAGALVITADFAGR